MSLDASISNSDIAVIAIVGRFPKSSDLDSFWNNLQQGKECLSFFSNQELAEAGIAPEIINDPRYVKAHGVLTEVDLFDAQFFEITQAEAELIDPQQRLFLHYCLQAIESAGYNQDTYSGLISVYAGVSVNTYLYNDIYPNIEPPDTLKQFHLMVANDKDFLATRVSYKLNFKGPSYTVQTACSTSLVAIHQACQGLLNGECDLALAGGVTVKLPQITGYLYEEGQIFSADGHVYAFDSRANGTVLGNGIGIVVLKLLKDALADGDTIHAVIKSSATNNDGSFKASYSAPSKDGQALVIAEAQALAGVNGDDISYVEAHGTGTLLGDPVEIAALTQAFRKTTDKKQFCGIGSVKTNLGHLDAASGVAGLIKTVLMLKNRQLVPSLNYQRPNPGIDFVNSPFYVVDKLGPWESPHGPRRAAVSSFGIGGTNAHVIVEEAPAIEPSGVSRNIQLLTLSAKTAPAMEQATENMAEFLHRHSDINLADLAFTLNIGRREYQHRRLFVLESGKLPNRLDADDCDLCFSNVLDYQPKTLVFEFLGTTVTSSRSTELYQQETIFRESVDDCWQLLEASGHQSGHALLEGFIFEFALAELWEDWGINPQAMLTQGVGEITAACFAGVLSLDDALSLLAYMSFAPDLQAFTEKLKGIELKAPKIPYTSAVTGTWISEAQATCPCYWAEQLAPALRQGQSHALETQTEVTAYVLPLGEEKNGSAKAVLSRLGQLWLAGFTIDWSSFYAEEKRHRIPLPTYPLAKERCWIASKPSKRPISETRPREPMADETYGVLLSQPVWQETSRVANMPETTPYEHRRVILCEMPGDAYQASIEAGLPGVSCINLQSPETNIEDSFAFYVAEIFTAVQGMLRTPLPTRQANAARGIMLQIVAPSGSGRMFSGLVGLLKTARLENPKFIAQLIELERIYESAEVLDILRENQCHPEDCWIRYRQDKRCLQLWSSIPQPTEAVTWPWKNHGVYVITGGLGGLGFVLAKEIANKTENTTLILIGRSALNKHKRAQLKELQNLGAKAEYRQLNIADKAATTRLFKNIHVTPNGIIHAAGAIVDGFIIRKNRQSLSDVLSAKVSGLVNLDQASKDLNLDFLVSFSSVVAIVGNPGQADYAAANAFMDAYAQYRQTLVTAQQRHGQSLSINWPVWQEGGMQAGEAAKEMMRETLGMLPMQTRHGIEAFYQALHSGLAQVMVIEGELAKIRKRFFDAQPVADTESNFSDNSGTLIVDKQALRRHTVLQLKMLFKEVTHWNSDQIDEKQSLENYGIDSLVISMLNQKIAAVFGNVPKTLLYEYHSLSDLSNYFITEHQQRCIDWTGLQPKTLPATQPTKPAMPQKTVAPTCASQEPIAIIGISGRYPQANTLDQFWQNLSNGNNSCITEIPAQRWPLAGFFAADPETAIREGKSYSKWGAFLDGFAEFDPLFFNISAREAMGIDPQERLFLQECWMAFEDAGYAPSQLDEALRHSIGVFGGITKTGFNLWNDRQNYGVLFSTSFAALVNRVSHHLGFYGPSMPVDSMCSSSLVAIHHACKSLRNREINMALAGAVNLYLHPSNYVFLSQAGMVSASQQAAIFGLGGRGFIPSEGVGVVVLKRLSDAEQDRDDILALIRGSAVNHNGKTNGYTIPNPNQQAAVMQQALDDAGLCAQSISYLELAANGSEMGDAIEMSAINKVFAGTRQAGETGYRMGSLKPVIGHGEAVSGMAQLTKVLLQLRHKKFCPTPLADTKNPNIDFDTLPFAIQTRFDEWPEPQLNGQPMPRRAGINSFGAGGVNAHVIVEEYPNLPRLPANSKAFPVLFLLSAKSQQALDEARQQWHSYLQTTDEANLPAIAYSLQVKREAMKYRFACIVQEREELLRYLSVDRHHDAQMLSGVYFGDANSGNSLRSIIRMVEEHLVAGFVAEKDWPRLAELWIYGAEIPWQMLYGDNLPRHQSGLPGYAFLKKTFWTDTSVQSAASIPPWHGIDSPVENYTPRPMPIPELKAHVPTEKTILKNTKTVFDQSSLQEIILHLLKRLLAFSDEDELDIQANFWEIGLSSITTVEFINLLNNEFTIDLPETIIFDYPSIKSLSYYVASLAGKNSGNLQDIDAILLSVAAGTMDINDAEALLASR